MSDPSVDLVATVGPLDEVVVLLRELLHAAGANRAVAVIAGGVGRHDLVEPAVVDVERLNPIEVTIGDRVLHLPHAIELGDDGSIPTPVVPAFKSLPPFDTDPESGDIAAPLGGVEHYATATQQAAAALDGSDVLQLHWDTTRPQLSFSVTVRADASEPVVLGIGEESFPMPPGWPDADSSAALRA